ncbi:MAG: hypothetical protein KDE48_20545 [Anaerolineales bacterium]|nr:hypothetical protein [Anaerolineales bacterium]
MTNISIDNITDKARDTGTALTAAVPQSVSKPAQKAYDAVGTGVQWYLEQWEDVIEEAKALKRGDLADMNLKDFLASLPEAKVESDIPGRLRLRTKQIKGQSQLAKEGIEALAELEGISEVHVSALTGSVLLFFDRNQYESRDALLQAIR